MKLSEDKSLIRAIEDMRTVVAEIQHVIDHTSDSQEEDVRLLCKHYLELKNFLNEFGNQLSRHM